MTQTDILEQIEFASQTLSQLNQPSCSDRVAMLLFGVAIDEIKFLRAKLAKQTAEITALRAKVAELQSPNVPVPRLPTLKEVEKMMYCDLHECGLSPSLLAKNLSLSEHRAIRAAAVVALFKDALQSPDAPNVPAENEFYMGARVYAKSRHKQGNGVIVDICMLKDGSCFYGVKIDGDDSGKTFFSDELRPLL